MPVSSYMRTLRERVGRRLLLVPSVAAIIHDERGRILLLRQRDGGRWSLPAGAIEPGESPQQATVREVYEETGLTVADARLLDVVGGSDFRTTYPNGDHVEFTISVFACRVDGELRALDGEAVAFDWVERMEVAARLELPYPPELFDT